MRRWLAALTVGLMAAAMPAMAQAALLVFTFTASPLIVAVGDVTDYTFTFTNSVLSNQDVRCAEVLFPDELWISGLGTPNASNNRPWTSSLLGQWVLVKSDGGGGRLRPGESVTFTVTALATAPGAYVFDNHVHITSACGGFGDPNINGIPVPVTVVPGILPTPSPTATATPTPTPTPTPTATPATAATPIPTPKPTPRPIPVATPDTSTPTPTPTPTPTATPQASVSERATPVPPVPSPPASGGSQVVRVAPLGGGSNGLPEVGVGVDLLGLLDSPFEWIVPGAAVGVPGLLVIVFVGLQALGALAWIPAVRRMGDDEDRSRRQRRRPA